MAMCSHVGETDSERNSLTSPILHGRKKRDEKKEKGICSSLFLGRSVFLRGIIRPRAQNVREIVGEGRRCEKRGEWKTETWRGEEEAQKSKRGDDEASRDLSLEIREDYLFCDRFVALLEEQKRILK